jgi:UMF1 family MFS transporter
MYLSIALIDHSIARLPDHSMKQNDRRTIHAWSMYDLANSVFNLVVTTAIFPIYYIALTTTEAGTRIQLLGFSIENSAALSITLGIAFGIVALLSPLLSSIADYRGNHKSFMKFFCYLGAAGCGLLYFFNHASLAPLGLLGILIGTIGYSGSIVFYNSYLPSIASPEQQDKVSARGFAYGYIGATTLLIISFALVTFEKDLGVTDGTLTSRTSFLLTGLWWLGFAQIAFRGLPKGLYSEHGAGKRSLAHGYIELLKIWNTLKSQRLLRLFLFSFFFYIMGVQTVMFMASTFGTKVLHLGQTQLMITVLLLEYIGIAGAFLFAWISARSGNISALLIAVGVWICICAGSYYIYTPLQFYVAAFFIGIVMGGIQSLSRSTYAKMMPRTQHDAGYFSFYDASEKVAMMLGLIMFGTLDHITGSMRNSIIAVGIWFVIGFLLLLIVNRMSSKMRVPSPITQP